LLELELLLLPFIDAQLAALSDERLARFEALLDCDDLDIYEWLMARSVPAEELATIVAEVRGFLSRPST
jgi:antitoxin CptB